MISKTEKNSHSHENLFHVILGVNGSVGSYIAKELVQLGYKVRGVSRSGAGPKNIQLIKANALNLVELTTAISGADVVYHCVGLPYSQWFGNYSMIMENLIEAAYRNKKAGKKIKIVYTDNLYEYGEKGAKIGTISEKTPSLAIDKKGKLRKELTNKLLKADQDDKVIASIGQASDFFGPRALNSLFEFFIRPYITKNKPAEIFADLEKLHSFVYLPDFAKSLVILGTNSKADGKKWIVPHYEATSIKEFISRFYKEVGINIDPAVKSRPFFQLSLVSLFNKEVREFKKMTYQLKNDWVIDDLMFRKTFPEFQKTPLKQAFSETFKWYNEK